LTQGGSRKFDAEHPNGFHICAWQLAKDDFKSVAN